MGLTCCCCLISDKFDESKGQNGKRNTNMSLFFVFLRNAKFSERKAGKAVKSSSPNMLLPSSSMKERLKVKSVAPNMLLLSDQS